MSSNEMISKVRELKTLKSMVLGHLDSNSYMLDKRKSENEAEALAYGIQLHILPFQSSKFFARLDFEMSPIKGYE